MTADTPGGSYHEAVRALQARGRFGIRLGLGRTKALLRAMGDPHRELRGALIAGTNGKGSVLALAGSALRSAGLRVGETPKPHLVTYRERIAVDGRPIAVEDFTRHVRRIAEESHLRQAMSIEAHRTVQSRDWEEAARMFWEMPGE